MELHPLYEASLASTGYPKIILLRMGLANVPVAWHYVSTSVQNFERSGLTHIVRKN
jgi:hypothetical protein